ncbi:MAG: glycosyltransferase [Candidatus Colwellbacteria bacterium]|nr:glycosyltransferase [Candidatus Colwellbacteria bacterium]
MKQLTAKIKTFHKERGLSTWMIFYLLVYLVLVIKFVTFQELDNNFLFGVYSIAVSVFILSRFALAYLYDPKGILTDENYEPTVSFGIPVKNEEDNVRETILRIAQSDYPRDKFDIIAVNDGSTDNSLEEMRAAKAIASGYGVKVKIINWKVNRGKREGMAEAVRQSTSDIIVFVDSDSFVERDAARAFVKYFSDPRVAAVAGHAYVANADVNTLTKMQAVRYYVAFKAYKAAEALFGSVTCCSGCSSAYRREYVLQVLEPWLYQKFMGVRCTYGDDRSLTNFLLKKGYKTIFAPEAIAHTIVPETMKQFLRQQLRWKKSWVRESLKAGGFMWKRNPLMALSFYLGIFLTLMAPVVVARAMIWYPYATGRFPFYYIIGIFLMALIYGLYYFLHTKDRNWVYGIIFTTFYTLILMWQLPYAIATIRDPKWGTR